MMLVRPSADELNPRHCRQADELKAQRVAAKLQAFEKSRRRLFAGDELGRKMDSYFAESIVAEKSVWRFFFDIIGKRDRHIR